MSVVKCTDCACMCIPKIKYLDDNGYMHSVCTTCANAFMTSIAKELCTSIGGDKNETN